MIVFKQSDVVSGLLGTEAELSAVAGALFNAPTANDSLTANLTLPVAGLFGSIVEWSSSNTAVISNTGVVTRPLASESNATVTLTYTIKIGETVAGTGTVIYTVLKEEPVSGPSDEETTYTESFGFITTANTSYTATQTHTDGSGFSWDILARLNIGSVTFGNAADGNYVQVTATGGISSFTVDLVRAFTNTNARSVELFVNGVSKGTFDISTTSDVVQVFTVDNINVSGPVVIRLVSTSPGSRGAFTLDNFSWTTYTVAE